MGEKLKVSYNFDYVKGVFNYILIPVFIVLLIVVVGLIIYSKKEKKNNTTEKYTYTINFWSYVMCIILAAALFAIALSFVVSLHKSIAGRPVDKNKLIYLVYVSPLIPLVFLISTGFHWIKMFLAYKNKKDNDNNKIEEQETLDVNNGNEILEETPNVEVENLEEVTAPIPVTPEIKETNNVIDNSETSIPTVIEGDNYKNNEEPEPSEVLEDVVENNNVKPINNIENNEITEDNQRNNYNIDVLEIEEKKEPEDNDIEVLDIN